MAHDKGSFDYKIINKEITKILDDRSLLNNTVQVAMPFIKATTTIQHSILGDGCVGFTLGLHAINQDVRYEDIYANKSGEMPLIGYTYDQNGENRRVYAPDPNTQTVGVFDRRTSLFSNTGARQGSETGKTFIRMPPPGITQVTVGRNKNGLLASAQLQISVPSLIQLEALHRTFLVPGLGMVLEWGQQFAVESTTLATGEELGDVSEYMFPWHDRKKLDPILQRLAKNEIGLPDILNNYVYPSKGQYMWMFGRVANFNVKSNSDGSFDCMVKIVGPSEDAWAYSTTNTVVPAKDPSIKIFCATNANSVYSYFTETSVGLNLKTLLDKTRLGGPWNEHVAWIEQGNQTTGEPTAEVTKPNLSNLSFADSEDAYFMTWRFFVNVVLNDEVDGLKAIFKRASLTDDERNKISTLLPYLTTSERNTSNSTPGDAYIDDPMESFVGMNKYLRSVDPSTLIIVNEMAARLAYENPQYNIPSSAKQFYEKNENSDKFKKLAWFDVAAKSYFEDQTNPDKGFLSSGVWISHKAVVESMAGGDTILRGIVNLLERMNQATLNYWQLTVDNIDPTDTANVKSHNYMIVDANFRTSSDKAVSEFIDNVYTFNKYVRKSPRPKGGFDLVGSELIDCSVDLSLPKRLFSQIATLGLVQPSDLQAAGISTGSVNDPTDLTNLKSPKVSDPNDTLREMFAITVLDPKNPSEQGPDLTILPKTQRKSLLLLNSQCGKANTQLTAQTVGNSNRPENPIISETITDATGNSSKLLKDAAERLLAGDQCKKCKECFPESQVANPTVSTYSNSADLNAAAADFIAKEEGLPPGGKAYYDPPTEKNKSSPKPIVSIGYGHQIKENEYRQGYIQVGDERVSIVGERGIDTTMTRSQAKKLLELDIPNYVGGAKQPIGEARWNKLTVNQKVALTSYSYNVGSTRSLASRGITVAIDQNDSTRASQVIKSGIATVEGTPSQALANRRSKEAALFAKDSIGPGNTEIANPPTPTPTDPTCNDPNFKKICDECTRQSQIVKQVETQQQEEQEKIEAAADYKIRQFYGLRSIFRYVEIFPEFMVAQIADSADGNFANAFGASPGALSIAADLVLPGINGIRVGELFWIDRIPVFYKAFGAFQVMSIEDTISIDGWKTKLNARFNFLGKKWKESMYKKLTGDN